MAAVNWKNSGLVRRGSYIAIGTPKKKHSGNGESKEGVCVVLPYEETSLKHSSTQSLYKPVPELIESMKKTLISSLNAFTVEVAPLGLGVTIGGAGDLVGDIMDATVALSALTGKKMYGSSFFSQAWNGSQPSSFSLTCKVITGWKNKYSGKDEVVTPLRSLYQSSVPSTDDGTATGNLYNVPSPSSTIINVATDMFKKSSAKAAAASDATANAAADASARGETALAAQTSSPLSEIAPTSSTPPRQRGRTDPSGPSAEDAVATATDGFGAAALEDVMTSEEQRSGTYAIEVGYFDGNQVHVFFSLTDLVIQSSSLDLNTTLVDSDGYPCAGSITLNFESSDITTDVLVRGMCTVAVKDIT